MFEVVENAGMANLAGTKSTALFTDLQTERKLIHTPNQINTVYYAVESDYDSENRITPVIESLGIILNNSLIASDVGLTLDYQTRG